MANDAFDLSAFDDDEDATTPTYDLSAFEDPAPVQTAAPAPPPPSFDLSAFDAPQEDAVPDYNLARGFGQRAAAIPGGFLGVASDIASPIAEGIENITGPLPGFVWKEGDAMPTYLSGEAFKEYQQTKADGKGYFDTAEASLKDLNLGHVTTATWDSVKEEFSKEGPDKSPFGELLDYGLETGVMSFADMGAMVLNFPGYVIARAGEIGDERAKNSGREAGNLADTLKAAPFAIGSAMFDRYGLGKMAKGASGEGIEQIGKEIIEQGITKVVAKRVAGATAVEAGTEAFQEGVIEYIGERLGTDAAMDWKEMVDRGAGAAVAGGMMGAPVSAASTTVGIIGAPSPDTPITEALKSVEQSDDAMGEVAAKIRNQTEDLHRQARGADNLSKMTAAAADDFAGFEDIAAEGERQTGGLEREDDLSRMAREATKPFKDVSKTPRETATPIESDVIDLSAFQQEGLDETRTGIIDADYPSVVEPESKVFLAGQQRAQEDVQLDIPPEIRPGQVRQDFQADPFAEKPVVPAVDDFEMARDPDALAGPDVADPFAPGAAPEVVDDFDMASEEVLEAIPEPPVHAEVVPEVEPRAVVDARLERVYEAAHELVNDGTVKPRGHKDSITLVNDLIVNKNFWDGATKDVSDENLKATLQDHWENKADAQQAKAIQREMPSDINRRLEVLDAVVDVLPELKDPELSGAVSDEDIMDALSESMGELGVVRQWADDQFNAAARHLADNEDQWLSNMREFAETGELAEEYGPAKAPVVPIKSETTQQELPPVPENALDVAARITKKDRDADYDEVYEVEKNKMWDAFDSRNKEIDKIISANPERTLFKDSDDSVPTIYVVEKVEDKYHVEIHNSDTGKQIASTHDSFQEVAEHYYDGSAFKELATEAELADILEKYAEARQAPPPPLILTKTGAPFKTKMSANRAIAQGNLENHEVVEHEDGFAVKPKLYVEPTVKSEPAGVPEPPVKEVGGARSEAAVKRAAKPAKDTDELFDVLLRGPKGKQGIARKGAEVDEAHFKEKGVELRHKFPALGGRTYDEAAEHLAQFGFDVLDADGKPDATKTKALIDRHLAGEKIYAPVGTEAQLEANYEQMAADQYNEGVVEAFDVPEAPAEAITLEPDPTADELAATAEVKARQDKTKATADATVKRREARLAAVPDAPKERKNALSRNAQKARTATATKAAAKARQGLGERIATRKAKEQIEFEEKRARAGEPVYIAKVEDRRVNKEFEEAGLEVETNPTEAQIESGNYRKGHVSLKGIHVTIENPKGSFRTGKDAQGKKWRTEMKDHYGYVKRTLGADGDHVDVFVGPNPSSDKVFVVDQIDPKTGAFDEHKVIMGATTEKAAIEQYNRNYAKGWKGLSKVTEMSVEEFKVWVADEKQTKAPVYEAQVSAQSTEPGVPEPPSGGKPPGDGGGKPPGDGGGKPPGDKPKITAQSEIDRVIGTPDSELPMHRRVAAYIKKHVASSTTDVVQGVVDEFRSIYALEKGKHGGKLQDAALSAYKAAAFTKNLSGVMTGLMNEGMIEYRNGGAAPVEGSKGFIEIFKPLAKEGLTKGWEAWAGATRAKRIMAEDKAANLEGAQLLADAKAVRDKLSSTKPSEYTGGLTKYKIDLKHAESEMERAKKLQAQNREHLFSEEGIEVILADVAADPKRQAMFEQVHSEWQVFNNGILDLAVAAGVINADERAVWAKSDYVPFHRIAELGDQPVGELIKAKLSGQKSPIKKLEGGVGQITPITAMVQNMTHLVDASFKNIAMQRVTDLALATGAMTSIPDMVITDKSLNEQLVARDLDPDDFSPQQLEMWRNLFQRQHMQNDTVSVSIKGKQQRFYVEDKVLFRAISAMGPSTTNQLIQVLGIPKKVLTELVVADPGFSIANFLRDTASTYVTVGGVMKNPIMGAANGVRKSLMNGDAQWKISAAGGGGGGFYDTSASGVREQLAPINAQHVLDNTKKVWQFYKKLLGSTEAANRIAVYDSVIKAGGSEAEAAYQAMDVLNFSRHGDWAVVNFLTSTVPFMNARVQGLDRLMRGAQDNPGAFALKGLMLMGATMALMAKNGEDDRYWELQEWDRDTYYHFFDLFEYGDHYRLPKPFEVGLVFSTIPERAYEQTFRQDADMKLLGERMMHAFMSTFAMNPIVQIAKPLFDIGQNENSFTKTLIISESLKRVDPEAQYTPYTSNTFVEMAESMPKSTPDWMRSPIRLEYAFKGYFGTMGGYGLMMADAITREVTDSPVRPALRKRHTPVIGRFVRDGVGSSKHVGEIYAMSKEVNTLASTIRKYKKDNELEKAEVAALGKEERLAVRKGINRSISKMAAINKRIKAIYQDRDEDPTAKADDVDELLEQRNEIARDAYDKYEQYF